MALTDLRNQPITGLLPPQISEALIRVAWPSVAAHEAPAALGQALMKTIIGAPIAWLLLAPLYFGKLLPFLATRYTLTNRRIMIQKGLKPVSTHEVLLADIDEVRVVKDLNSRFYQAANIEIVSAGKVMLTLAGIPEPDAFKVSIVNACMAWVPGKAAKFAHNDYFKPAEPKADAKPPEKPAEPKAETKPPEKPAEPKAEAKPEESKPAEPKPEEKQA